jgi:hypothetical protein
MSGMLAAADHLCWAADDLRSVGFLTLADEIDSLLEILDAGIAIAEHRPIGRRSSKRMRTSSRDVIHATKRRSAQGL